MELAITTRRLNWPDCRNTRDLGGLPRPGGHTRSGVLIRTDNVGSLNAAGRQAMVDYGVNTVIDLRSESEVGGSPSPFAMALLPAMDAPTLMGEAAKPSLTYLHLPLIDDETWPALNEVAGIQEVYFLMLERRQGAFGRIFGAIAQAEGGVVFHCFAGKDRTGMVAALMLSLAQVDADAIAADFAATDVQLAAKYEEWLAAAPPEKRERMRSDLQCPPARIMGVLDHLNQRWGGVKAYLEAAGMTPAAIDRLSAKLA
jgi:protein-tyrosine phosphatase